MKRIDRYVLSNFFGGAAAALVFFIGMYLLVHFFSRLDNFSGAAENVQSVGYSTFQGFCRYYAVNLPFVLVEVAPFVLLMAAMWAAQNMARRNELIPVLVGGISFRRLALPILVAGVLIALGFTLLRESVLPKLASERYRLERMFKGQDDSRLKNLPLLEDSSGRLVSVREYDVQSDTAFGVEVRSKGAPSKPGVFAASARFEDDGPDGPGWYSLAETEPPLVNSRKLPTDLKPGDIEIEARALLFLPIDDIKRMMSRHPGRNDLEILLYGHYAYPFRTLILLLLGLPLVLRFTRKSPYAAIGLSLFLSVSFFAAQSVADELGRRGEILNPVLGAWLPVVLFGSLGLVLYETMPS